MQAGILPRPVRACVHLGVTHREGGESLFVPIFVPRRREAEDFPLSRRGALDEMLHLRLLAHLAPLVITLKRVGGGPPDEMVAETGAEVGGHVAGAVPGAHEGYEQMSGLC